MTQKGKAREGELLTQTWDIIGWWKEHFVELLNRNSPLRNSQSIVLGKASFISLARVSDGVTKLTRSNDKAPSLDKICPETLKTYCCAVIVDMPLQCHM